jgi:hypothetical protein
MKEMTAHDRFLERQRIANERAIEMGYGKAIEDAIVGGTGITKAGKRIDPADFYAEPKIGCVNHDCDKCKAVQEPLGYLEINDIESQREYPHNCRSVNLWHEGGEGMVAIYTTPPAQQKPWVDLTDEEIMAAPENLIACIAYVRNKLKEKNT